MSGPFGPVGHRRGRERRRLGQPRGLGQRDHVVAQREHVHVFDELEQAALVIDQQQDGVIGVDHSFGNFGHG